MNDPRLEISESASEPEIIKRTHVIRRILLSKRWLVVPPIALGLLVIFLMIRSRKEIPRSEIREQSVEVAIFKAIPESIETQVIGYGTANPSRSWTAISEVSGRIKSIHPRLESGNVVRTGETLLEIDDEDYRLRVLQRTSDLDSAKANYEELLANQANDKRLLRIEKELLQVTESEVDRTQRLRKANAISVSEVDTAKSNQLKQAQAVQRLENTLTLYPAKINSAKAKVAMAESALQEAKRNVSRTTILSPISGLLSGVDIESGQFVSVNQQLFQVRDNHRIEIEAQISVAQLNQLAPSGKDRIFSTRTGQWLKDIQAVVTSESGTETFRWTGKPIRLTESVDSQTRTIGVVVEVTNVAASSTSDSTSPTDTDDTLTEIGNISDVNDLLKNADTTELKIGTYCEVKLMGRPEQNVIAIPRTAFDGQHVYIVDEENRLQSRKVVRGSSVGDRVIVRSGITAGDKVIVRPPLPAIEGMLVRPQ